jgi:hypothetical protein
MLVSFTEPLSLNVTGSAVSLPRVEGPNDGDYRSADGLVELIVSHTYAKRTRRLLRVNLSKIASDPFKPAENVEVSMSYYIVFDLPPAGFTNAEALTVFTGSNALFTASTNQMITKLLGGEA